MIRPRTLLTVITAGLALAACSRVRDVGARGALHPGSTPEVTRKVIERTPIAGSDEELRLMLIDYPPGASAPIHRHPVIGLCYVIHGTAESQYTGEAMRTLRAGDSYQDSATKTHLLFRNASSTDHLRFTCAAKIGEHEDFAQPVVAPSAR
jgi:quercetin dioxygenase-like cupin family protein